MDIEQKMKEVSELLSKTAKELSELMKKNEELLRQEIKKVEEVIRQTIKVCSEGKVENLRDVKAKYDEKVKICNEKAVIGFQAAKTKCDEQLKTVKAIKSSMKQILKDCLETNEFVKCVAKETKNAMKERKQVSRQLETTVKNAEVSILKQLKEAVKCHADAQTEALNDLHKILNETKDCIK
ncbi:uncharacterized protein LOC122714667 [Apis laboriosa]|uniref:uncharacterized protein LOC122714667 n=1 Tax=Apis laboriosa TaxID=183418 RepID=UPI001CC45086|nr:uncharacterized protein LOC122714667 [Apis laboriosa]